MLIHFERFQKHVAGSILLTELPQQVSVIEQGVDIGRGQRERLFQIFVSRLEISRG